MRQEEGDERLDFFVCFDGVGSAGGSDALDKYLQTEPPVTLFGKGVDGWIREPGGIAHFTSPTSPRCHVEELVAASGGGGLSQLFPIIRGKDFKSYVPRETRPGSIVRYRDLIVMAYRQMKLVMNYGFISGTEGSDDRTLPPDQQFINLYIPSKPDGQLLSDIKFVRPQCVFKAPIGAVREIIGGNE